MTTFDFGNNNGPVPAHKHPNGDGWVANTAYVADSAYIGPDAKVSDNAQVFDRAIVEGYAWVYGNAHVFEDAWLSDIAMVGSLLITLGKRLMTVGLMSVIGLKHFLGNLTNSI